MASNTPTIPSDLDTYVLLNVPSELLSAIRADSRERGMSLNNIVCQVMAERYRMECEPSERQPRVSMMDYIYLRLPATVMEAVRVESVASKWTMRSIFLDELSRYYGLTPPKPDKSTGSGRPRKKGTPNGN